MVKKKNLACSFGHCVKAFTGDTILHVGCMDTFHIYQEEVVHCLWDPARVFCLSYLKEMMRNTNRVTP